MEPSRSKSKQQKRNWLELPSDVTANILYRIGMVNILLDAQKVCTAWRKICLDPAMWRVINMNDFLNSIRLLSTIEAKEMFKHAVERSQGQLVDITLMHRNEIPELLPYVADRSSQLKRLEMACYYGSVHTGWTTVLMKFPLLEELGLFSINVSKEDIETVSRCCSMLKTLNVNREAFRFRRRERFLTCDDEIAIAIGENLLELRRLELIGNNITNTGLQVILDGCPHLETLDLRKCLSIDLKGDLGKRCSRQIKHLKLPNDSLEDCPCIYKQESETDDEGYYYDPPELYDGYISQ